MLKLENTEVFGWEAAIRGMRNPMNSWSKSDTQYFDRGGVFRVPKIGKNDLKLMKSLSNAGNDHAKFLRMINVTVDITAPLYWWKEHDQYKVGTTTNSCSTMHKIHAKEFTREDFSWEHLYSTYDDRDLGSEELSDYILTALNRYRDRYLQTKEKEDWLQMIQLLPSSYNQKRTVQFNYQVLKSMYFARKDHKLDEWHILCDWMLTLPYFEEVCVDSVADGATNYCHNRGARMRNGIKTDTI